MAGQQNIKRYDKEHLYNKYKKNLETQVIKSYIEDKFAISAGYNEDVAIYEYLLSEVYSTKNCEIIKFIDKKLKGALGNYKIKIVDLESLQLNYGDTYNYYYSEANYEKVEW
jgi:hypothetical protein